MDMEQGHGNAFWNRSVILSEAILVSLNNGLLRMSSILTLIGSAWGVLSNISFRWSLSSLSRTLANG